ncbi:MAG: glycosyltransferase [Pseudomonadota bacterium]
MIKFSVVIPLYNGANVIEATLDSVLAQTYRNYEIVLVNDGSPDNVGNVVKNYIADHPGTQFVYLEQRNKGLGGARNSAIRLASGEVIAILDQDDLWYPKKLERVAQVYEEYPEVEIVCHNCFIRKNGKITKLYQTGPFEKEMHRKMLFGGNRLATLATSFKKSVLEKVGYFSEDTEKIHLVEDYDLWMRMARANCKFSFISDVLAEYIQHDSNYSLQNIERMFESEMYVINSHYKLLSKRRFLDWARLRRRKAILYFWAVSRLPFSAGSFSKRLRYLMLTIGNDPLFLFSLFSKSIKKIYKILLAKRSRR